MRASSALDQDSRAQARAARHQARPTRDNESAVPEHRRIFPVARSWDPVDRNFYEVIFFRGPSKGADDFHRAMINRNHDLRGIGVSGLTKRAGERFILGGKIGIVIGV